MGYMHIEGELQPLTTLSPPASAWPRETRCTSAMDDALAAIEAAGRRGRVALVKSEARRNRTRPAYLDSIMPGLSTAHPEFILGAVAQQARIPWGRVDMFGVISVKLAGAALYARWLRRIAKLEMSRG